MKKMYSAFCLLIALSICKPSVINAQVDVNDSLALVDLYNSADGPNWYDNTNWLTTNPLSTWYGVSVSNNRVTSINLSYNKLTGSIPAELGNTANLTELLLYNNQLSGSIPTELGKLQYLKDLALHHNQLSGSIPAELGNATNLTYLSLSNNQLSGSIPDSLGKLKQLFSLYLSNNQLSGSIPKSLTKLPYLHVLTLSNNQLSGSIPRVLGYFPHLSSLDLDHNQLSGTIPAEFGNLINVQFISLSYNKLRGQIPATFSNLTSLRELDLRDNQLTDTVPVFLASFHDLRRLQIQFNHFTFNGIEQLAGAGHRFLAFRYGFEKKIKVNQTNNTLSVYAGGTLSNNTYTWFNNGVLVSTINGDSTYTPTASGNYSVEVINSIATELTLKSDTVSFNITSVAQSNTSVKENFKNNLLVYPNPAKTNITVSFAAAGNYSLKLSDANGNVLQTKTGVAVNSKNTVQLNVGNYAAGSYFITVTNAKKEAQTLRFNKQ